MLRARVIPFVLTCTAAGTAAAQEHPFVMEDLPPHLEARIEQEAQTLLLNKTTFPDGFFLASLKVWPAGQPVRVCFFGGSTSLRAKIASTASAWTTAGANLSLDFGDIANPRSCGTEYAHIRIGFRYKGYWSMVGTDSERLAGQFEQSMNFAMFDINPPAEPEFTRVVLHEFGHALGFQHEHQSALAPCAQEFNWPAIYTYLKGSPNFWSVEQIDHNLKPIAASATDTGPFDKTSIMLYAFPANFYTAGVNAECLTLGNNTLSQGDVAGLLKFYPADSTAATTVRQESLQTYFEAVDQSDATDLEKSLAKVAASNVSKEGGPLLANQPNPFGQWNLMMFQLGPQLQEQRG